MYWYFAVPDEGNSSQYCIDRSHFGYPVQPFTTKWFDRHLYRISSLIAPDGPVMAYTREAMIDGASLLPSRIARTKQNTTSSSRVDPKRWHVRKRNPYSTFGFGMSCMSSAKVHTALFPIRASYRRGRFV